MSIISWLFLGLIAGFLASKIVNRRGSGILADIVIGIVGAFLGGFAFERFGAIGVTGFDLRTLVVAVLGAIVLLIVVNFFRRND